MTSHLRPGILAALAVLILDQASKLWLLFVFDIAHRGAVPITPFFDLVLAWNVGISFGWLQNDSQFAQIGLMVIKAVAVIVLAIWMARSRTPIATVAMRVRDRFIQIAKATTATALMSIRMIWASWPSF